MNGTKLFRENRNEKQRERQRDISSQLFHITAEGTFCHAAFRQRSDADGPHLGPLFAAQSHTNAALAAILTLRSTGICYILCMFSYLVSCRTRGI